MPQDNVSWHHQVFYRLNILHVLWTRHFTPTAIRHHALMSQKLITQSRSIIHGLGEEHPWCANSPPPHQPRTKMFSISRVFWKFCKVACCPSRRIGSTPSGNTESTPADCLASFIWKGPSNPSSDQRLCQQRYFCWFMASMLLRLSFCEFIAKGKSGGCHVGNLLVVQKFSPSVWLT